MHILWIEMKTLDVLEVIRLAHKILKSATLHQLSSHYEI